MKYASDKVASLSLQSYGIYVHQAFRFFLSWCYCYFQDGWAEKSVSLFGWWRCINCELIKQAVWQFLPWAMGNFFLSENFPRMIQAINRSILSIYSIGKHSTNYNFQVQSLPLDTLNKLTCIRHVQSKVSRKICTTNFARTLSLCGWTIN